jgi:phage/plasmid-like protein (TIGR03299 family)
MSHEIVENIDTVVFGNNKPAWHGLGTVFAGLMSPMRVFAEGVGMRDIIEHPVMIDGIALDGVKGLLGLTANGQKVPLSVVGENYGVLKSQTVFEILEEVYKGRAVVETAGTLRAGKREWVLVKRDSWDVTSGDKILSYDLWLNRHDGSGCFDLHRTNVRVVCANTWKLAVQSGERMIGVRHTCNVEAMVRSSINALGIMEKAELEERRKIREMAETPMSRGDSVAFFRRLLNVKNEEESTRTLNQLATLDGLFTRGTGNEGKTRWDGFNAVTEFVDHSRSSRVSEGRDKAEVRFESSLLGTGDSLKARAFDLLSV